AARVDPQSHLPGGQPVRPDLPGARRRGGGVAAGRRPRPLAVRGLTMDATRRFLESLGLPRGDAHDLPTSPKRFPDGAQYRVEIPSTEGPRCLAAVLEEADRYGLTIHRVSQGSGTFLQTDDEIRRMAELAQQRSME